MKKKEIWLLGLLISVVMAVEGWSLSYKPRAIVNREAMSEATSVSRLDWRSHLQHQVVDSMRVGGETSSVSFESHSGTAPVAEVEELDLELLGTAIGNIKDPIAFIKDLKSKKQGTYRLGSLIRQAKIIEISMGKVVFEQEGQRMVLRLGNRGRAWAKIDESPNPIVSVSEDNRVVSKRGVLSGIQSLYKTLRSVKVKPHYQSDEVVGLMIDGIAQGSLIEEAGIQDKDIIKTVNSQRINSYQKALQVFRKVKNQKEIKVSLLRDGQIKRLCYRIDN